jgi:eukaryotic-like serine/threonine-protein kinase
MDPISIGTVIGGRYRVVASIGEGAMGAVYRVEHLDSHEVSALKLLHADLGRIPGIIARFEREAIAATRIDHPNVVHAIDFGCSPDGAFFLVLELVEGRDLRAEMQAGPMDPARAINVMRGVVAGVRAAHEKGVIHRDLKPENIMLIERDGNGDFVKLLDFGIARLDSASNPQSGMQPLTLVGSPVGTPEYMSPEQVLGTPVDARSDLYSLGVIFFELLAGSCPFDGNVPRLLQHHLTSEPPELPPAVADENPDLARIVRILLAKKPKNRFQTAADLAEALNASAAGPARQRAHVAPTAPEPESRTLASFRMQASLAKKRLVGIVAPQARRHLGSRRRGVIVAVCGAAMLLVIILVAARRDRDPLVAGDLPDPSATARADPSRLDTPGQPSATGEVTKGAASKARRKSSEGTSLPKSKAK